MHCNRHLRHFVGTLRCVLLFVVAIEHIGHVHSRFATAGVALKRIAHVRRTCSGACGSLGRSIRVHIVEENVFGVVVVEQQLVVARLQTYYVALSWHINHIVDARLAEYVHTESGRNLRAKVVVCHTVFFGPFSFRSPYLLVFIQFPLLLVSSCDAEVELRCMNVVVEAQVLVFAR